jgi:hypothetical protein
MKLTEARLRNLARMVLLCRLKDGLVYAIRHGETGPVKFGYAKNARKRLALLQTGTPEPLLLLLTVPGSVKLEKMIHRMLWPLRVRGEWFRAEGATLEVLAALASTRWAAIHTVQERYIGSRIGWEPSHEPAKF